jgi:hypothetical protein
LEFGGLPPLCFDIDLSMSLQLKVGIDKSMQRKSGGKPPHSKKK